MHLQERMQVSAMVDLGITCTPSLCIWNNIFNDIGVAVGPVHYVQSPSLIIFWTRNPKIATTDVLDKGISIVLRCPGNLRADSPITIDAYLPKSMASAALYKRTGAHVPLLETCICDFAMLHLASLQDHHDASSFPVPDAINLQMTPCRYQFK
jgi:hypothetical protein